MSLILRLAWRSLWRHPGRSAVLLAAVAVGGVAMLLSAALMRGMVQRMVEEGVARLPGHVQLHRPGFREDPSARLAFPYPRGALRAVLDGPLVAAWSARLRLPAVLSSERELAGVELVGVEPAAEAAVSFLGRAPVAGRRLAGPEDGSLILGRALARRLETGLGRRLVVAVEDPAGRLAERGARVAGLYRAPLEATEAAQAFTGLGPLQRLTGLEDRVTEVAVRAAGPEGLGELVAALRRAAPGLEVSPWPELAPFVAVSARLYDRFTWVWYLVVLAALAFGLVNTLLMAVLERTRELALLLALGMRPARLVGQVLLEALLLLALGLGLALAAVAAVVAGVGAVDLGPLARGAELVGLPREVPLLLHPADVGAGVGLLLLLGLAGAAWPAWRAARIEPGRALGRAPA